MFTPKIGEDDPNLTHIFQLGWFNHQLDSDWLLPPKFQQEEPAYWRGWGGLFDQMFQDVPPVRVRGCIEFTKKIGD